MKKSTHKYSSPMLPSSVTKVTIFSRFVVLFLLIILPLAGFYIGMYYQQIFDLQAQALSSLPQTTPPASWLVLRPSDNDKMFTVTQGTRVTLDLGNAMRWQVTSFNQNVLQQINSATFVAAQKGTAVISLAGRAICKANAPCPLFVMMVKITINVK